MEKVYSLLLHEENESWTQGIFSSQSKAIQAGFDCGKTGTTSFSIQSWSLDSQDYENDDLHFYSVDGVWFSYRDNYDQKR